MPTNRFLLFPALVVLAAALPAQAQVTVSTLATGFSGSGDVAVDPEGNIYVGNFGDLLSNSNGTQVLRFTPDGQMSVFATGFQGASGNTFHTDGNLYQSSLGAGAVLRVDPAGNVTTAVSGLAGGSIGNAFDSQGNLYVNSCGNNLINKIDPQGNITLFASGFPFNCPNGVTVDDQDNVYSVNFGNGNIAKITPEGTVSLLATTPGSSFRPGGGNGHVAFANGVLYVASNATSQIFEITLDGQMRVIAGSGQRGHADGDGASASFSFPNGVAASPDGRLLYVNESESTAGAVLNGNTFPLTPNRLRVIDLGFPDDTFAINAGLTGSWFEPATSGQGLLFDVIAASDEFFAAWFTFEEAGAKVGAPEQRWVTLQGTYVGDTATLTILSTSGGVFDAPDLASNSAVGSASVLFASCTEATLDYSFDAGPSGSIDLIRLTPDTLCTTQTQSR